MFRSPDGRFPSLAKGRDLRRIAGTHALRVGGRRGPSCNTVGRRPASAERRPTSLKVAFPPAARTDRDTPQEKEARRC